MSVVQAHLGHLDVGVFGDLVARHSVDGGLDNVHVMPRLLPSLFGSTRAWHDVLLYLQQVAVGWRGEGGEDLSNMLRKWCHST